MPINPIDPINGMAFGLRPYASIRPFTFVYGRTHADTLEDLRKYVRVEIVDHLNVENAELNKSINETVEAVVSTVNDKLIELETGVGADISDLQAEVNAAVQQVISSSIGLQSAVLAGIVRDPVSEGRAELDKLFATVSKTIPVGQGDTEYLVRIKGAAMGVTGNNQDYTPVVAAIVADMATQPNNAAAKILFPRGQINLLPGNGLFADGRTYTLEGEGINLTEIRPHASTVAGDLIDLRGSRSSIRNMTLNGRVSSAGVSVAPNLTAGLVLNGPSQSARDVRIIDMPGNGMVIGRDVSAVGWQTSGIAISGCRGVGLRVHPSSGSIANTDGQWIGGFIGQSGLANAIFEAASTTITDLHSWGAGMMALGLPATDRAGVVVKARNIRFNTLESETNMGPGVFIDGSVDGQLVTFVGGHIWGNMGQGIVYSGTTKITALGVSVNRNGVANAAAPVNSIAYSGMHNSGSTDIKIIGCDSWDNGASIPAITAPGGSNNPFPGRPSSTVTQAYHYTESATGCDRIQAVGNKWRSQDVRDTLKPIDVTSPRFDSVANDLGDYSTRNIASAATITIPSTHSYYTVSGTVVITAITDGVLTGKPVKLLFTAGSPGGINPADTTGTKRLRLAGGVFAGSQFSSIELLWTDNGWVELSRSVK